MGPFVALQEKKTLSQNIPSEEWLIEPGVVGYGGMEVWRCAKNNEMKLYSVTCLHFSETE